MRVPLYLSRGGWVGGLFGGTFEIVRTGAKTFDFDQMCLLLNKELENSWDFVFFANASYRLLDGDLKKSLDRVVESPEIGCVSPSISGDSLRYFMCNPFHTEDYREVPFPNFGFFGMRRGMVEEIVSFLKEPLVGVEVDHYIGFIGKVKGYKTVTLQDVVFRELDSGGLRYRRLMRGMEEGPCGLIPLDFSSWVYSVERKNGE